MRLVICLIYCVTALSCFPNESLIKAIHQVETGGRIGKILGDNGLALGPLQIHKGCWKDAVEYDKSIGGIYEDCANLEYSKKIFLAYQRRYSKFTGGKTELMARVWNGGVGGIKYKNRTNYYWNKVKKHL